MYLSLRFIRQGYGNIRKSKVLLSIWKQMVDFLIDSAALVGKMLVTRHQLMTEKKDIRAFDDYMPLNSKKKRFAALSTITTRSTFFKKVNDKQPVMINVGLMRAAEDNKLSLVRGSKPPVQVKKGFEVDQVFKSAA